MYEKKTIGKHIWRHKTTYLINEEGIITVTNNKVKADSNTLTTLRQI